MYCEKCGNQIDENAKFCPNCGNGLSGAKEMVVETPIAPNTKKKKANTCSILSIVFASIGIIPLLNILFVPAAIILAIIGFATGKNKGAKAKIASVIVLVISVIISLLWMVPAITSSPISPSTNHDLGDQNTPTVCSHSYHLKSTEATCLSGGYATYQCSLCDETKREYESALGHSWLNNKCEKCGKVKDLELDPKNNNILTIDQINIDINTVGGVEPDITYTNHTNKQIAYIYFTIKYYDRMGYAAYCKYDNSPIQRLKVTGPINAGETDTSYWDPVMYNSSTAVSQPQKIEIVYTDGTEQTIICTGRYWYTGSFYGGELHE